MASCLRNLLALACASAVAADVEAGQRCLSFRTPVTALSDDCSLMQMTSSPSGAGSIWSEKDMVADRHGPPAKTTKSREQEPTAESDASEANNITVFFNIFQRDATLTRRIVDEQIQSLQKHFDIIHQVRYITIDGPPELTYECDKCQKHAHYSHGDEVLTLQALFEHCAAGRSAKVAYIHTKGSFNPIWQNEVFRKFLMRGVASESCLQMPSQCNICGSRFSPLPHHHMPGNMWVAKCDYIRELIPPNNFTTAMNELVSSSTSNSFKWIQATRRVNWRMATDRFAMEHWALSHPQALPCDLYRGDYAWGYVRIPTTDWTPNLFNASQVQMKEFVNFAKQKKNDLPGAVLSDIWSWRLHEWMQLYHAVPEPGTWAPKLYDQ